VTSSERVPPGGIEPMRTGSEVVANSSFTVPCHSRSLLLVIGTTTAIFSRPVSRAASSRESPPQMPSSCPRATLVELVNSGGPSRGTASVNGVPASSAHTRTCVSPRSDDAARGTANARTNANSATRERSIEGRALYAPMPLRSPAPLPGRGASGYSRCAMAANSCLRAATAPSSPGKVKLAESR
jgi:hypothetical protein